MIDIGDLLNEAVPDPDLDGYQGVDGGIADNGRGDELGEAHVVII